MIQQLAQVLEGKPCAIAVSGGGDSMALAHLCLEAGLPMAVLHFDHNLRETSAEEAQWLAQHFACLNVPFYSEAWAFDQKPDAGRIQAEGRAARYAFFSTKCEELGLKRMLLAHTADDVAETFLMRLFYGSGLQGLKPMADKQTLDCGLQIVRPLLQVKRNALRTYLKEKGQPWLEDPSNANPDFVRVRTRHWLEQLNLAEAFCGLSQSFAALDETLKQVDAKLVLEKTASHAFIAADVLKEPSFLQERVVKGLVKDLANHYPPRTKQIQRLMAHLNESDKAYELGHLSWQRQGGVVEVKALAK